MFGMSKLMGYLAAAGALIMTIVGIFYSGKSSGKDEAELEARDAVDEAEAETSAQALTEQEKINAIHKADHSSIDPSKLN